VTGCAPFEISQKETDMSQKHPERHHDSAAKKRRSKVAAQKKAKKARRVELRKGREKQ
jgi:hypothetical protein